MPGNSMTRNAVALAAFLLVTFAAAGIGGWATAAAVRDWYPTLAKPSWNPPAAVFGPVWTVLYVCIAVAGFLAWRRVGLSGRPAATALFLTQLALNAAWSVLFFGLRQPGWAFAEVVLLWLAILATTVVFFRIAPWPGGLFVPYLAWVTFAAVLNFTIWRLNA
jgi:tryptophan-rich sensory protein